jgi:hypothetical protein
LLTYEGKVPAATADKGVGDEQTVVVDIRDGVLILAASAGLALAVTFILFPIKANRSSDTETCVSCRKCWKTSCGVEDTRFTGTQGEKCANIKSAKEIRKAGEWMRSLWGEMAYSAANGADARRGLGGRGYSYDPT